MDLVIVTGMSGAGKNTAIKLLEDYGYFCVDNLPVRLIDKFADLALESPETMNRIAIGIDTRGGQHLDEIADVMDRLSGRFASFSLLFMDANDECLLRRYQESRRVHPLAELTNSLEEAFNVERDLLQGLRERADYVIDTSFLRPQQLQSRLYEIFIRNSSFKSLNVTVMTFGYKYGIPEESDYVIDVRFLPNPFYDESLREKTGLEEEVRAYVLNNSSGGKFMDMLTDMFRFILAESVKSGKNSVVIAIGCTGGRHRSVSVAWELYERLRSEEASGLNLYHRDIDKNRR